MSLRDEETLAHNEASKDESKDCAIEHMKELERQRVESEKNVCLSTSKVWEKRRKYWKQYSTNKVLSSIIRQLQ